MASRIDDVSSPGTDARVQAPDETATGARIASACEDGGTGRSNFAAFLLGGIVVSGGLLALLYYDSNGLDNRSPLTTGSLGLIETVRPASPPLRP